MYVMGEQFLIDKQETHACRVERHDGEIELKEMDRFKQAALILR